MSGEGGPGLEPWWVTDNHLQPAFSNCASASVRLRWLHALQRKERCNQWRAGPCARPPVEAGSAEVHRGAHRWGLRVRRTSRQESEHPRHRKGPGSELRASQEVSWWTAG